MNKDILDVEVYEDEEEGVSYSMDEDIYGDNESVVEYDRPENLVNFYAEVCSHIGELCGYDEGDLRQIIFEQTFRTISDLYGYDFEDILLSCGSEDTKYISFIQKLYPAIRSIFDKAINDEDRDTLEFILGKSVAVVLWNEIEREANERGKSVDDIIKLGEFSGLDTMYACKVHDLGVSDFIDQVAENAEDGDEYLAVFTGLVLLKNLVAGVKVKEDKSEDNKVDKVVADDEVDLMELKATVNDIMNVYDKLYQPCFVNKPVGILTSEGILSLDKSGQPRYLSNGRVYAKKLYEALVAFSGGYLPSRTSEKMIGSEFLDSSGRLVDTYSPLWHLRNIYGMKEDGTFVSTWMEYREYLMKIVESRVYSVLKKVKDDSIRIQMSLKELFTNCIIIDSFDRINALQMRLKVEGLKSGLGDFLTKKSADIFATTTGKVINEEDDHLKIKSLLFVFDEKYYTNEILFAYKAYRKLLNAGVTPSAKSVIVGRGLDGKDITENFDDNGNIVIGIIAGSRSGKGVLTLNILASLYADDCPVFYLDFKPDMAATLWDLEHELNAKGVNARIFAIDSLANQRMDNGVLIRPRRWFPYGLNAPEDVNLTVRDYALIPYLKSLQLMCLMAKLRSSGKMDNRQKMFFVLDELQEFNRNYGLFLSSLIRIVRENRPKKGEEPSFDYEYANKLLNVFKEDLKAGINAVVNTTGGQGRVSLILLGQKADPKDWQLEDGSWRDSVFGNLVAHINLKYIGRDSGISPTYGLTAVSFRGKELIENRGYFARYRGSRTSKDGTGITLIKTYLVLNKNDFNLNDYLSGNLSKESFTGQLLTSINDEALRDNIVHRDLLNEDKSVREEVGFSGLMKLIIGSGSDHILGEKMSIGYNIAQDLLNRMGLNYSCVEEYLFDCSYDSIFTLSELESLLGGVGDSSNVVDVVKGVDWFADEGTGVREKAIDEGLSDGYVGGFVEDDEDSGGEIPLFDDGDEGLGVHDTVVKREFTMRSGLNVKASANNVFLERHRPVETYSGYDGEYTEQIKLPMNPFKAVGAFNRPLSMLNSLRLMSNFLMDEILRIFGDYRRIEQVEVTNSCLVINNIAFKPRFSDEIINSLPIDIVEKVRRGNVVDLFYFDNIYKFRNLSVLRIDNVRLAEGRVRRELGLGQNVSWSRLFDRLPNLRELWIGGERITDYESAKLYDDRGRGGYTLTEKVRNALGVGREVFADSPVARIWESRPVRVFIGALGWTLGVKAVVMASTVFGAWGLLFGAFAGLGAYREFRNRRNK